MPNTILQGGEFRRLHYSNSILTLSGMYLLMTCKLAREGTERTSMNYAVNCDKHWLPVVKELEMKLLKLVPNRNAKQRLYENLSGGFIKFSEKPQFKDVGKIIVKIPGVWSTERDCGLTYKLMPAC